MTDDLERDETRGFPITEVRCRRVLSDGPRPLT
jgi:hypothetical protein